MKAITIIFTWTTSAGIQDTYTITKTKNAIFDNIELENKLQQLSPLLNTTVIDNYVVNAKGTKIKVTLVAKDLIQTLPLELKLKIASDSLPILRLNKTHTKSLDRVINSTNSLELFSHPTLWKNLTPKARKNAVALLQHPKQINTFLHWLNHWISSPKGAKKFLCWIEIFGSEVENLYENYCKTNRYLRTLYALVVRNIHKINEFALEKALKEIQKFPNIFTSINITLAFLHSDKNTIQKPNMWFEISNPGYYVNFQNADFSQRIIKGADFTGFNLKNADFSFTTLTRTNFSGAILIGAKFMVTRLTYTSLRQANLQGANFENATLTHSIFSGANLTGTSFQNCVEIKYCDFAHTYIPPSLKAIFKNTAGLRSSQTTTQTTIHAAINKTSNIQELIAIYHNNLNEFLTIHHSSELNKAFGIFFKSSTSKWIESFTAHVKQHAIVLLQNDNQQHLSAEEQLLLEYWKIPLGHCKLLSGQ